MPHADFADDFEQASPFASQVVRTLKSGVVEAGKNVLQAVRLQMVWDNLSCLGTEALARLGLRLGGFQLMFQSSLSDGVAFDPFSFQKDGSASAEVDVGRCQVL